MGQHLLADYHRPGGPKLKYGLVPGPNGRGRFLSVLVQSRTTPGTFWEVTMQNGGWECRGGPEGKGCKFWQKSKDWGTFEECRHILEVRDSITRGTLVDFNGMAITSLLAFRDLLESGAFNKDCSEVLGIIERCPGVCDHEIQRIWNRALMLRGEHPRGINSVTGRRNWLMNAGWIHNGVRKLWRETNKTVETWRIAWAD